jgi:hypothetical protein
MSDEDNVGEDGDYGFIRPSAEGETIPESVQATQAMRGRNVVHVAQLRTLVEEWREQAKHDHEYYMGCTHAANELEKVIEDHTDE